VGIWPPLSDVVQKCSEEEWAWTRHLGGKPRREGKLLGKLAARDVSESIDGG
jgi:hypothetical protein